MCSDNLVIQIVILVITRIEGSAQRHGLHLHAPSQTLESHQCLYERNYERLRTRLLKVFASLYAKLRLGKKTHDARGCV